MAMNNYASDDGGMVPGTTINQFLSFGIIAKRCFGEGADQDFQKLWIDGVA